jgi:hypothetical protein
MAGSRLTVSSIWTAPSPPGRQSEKSAITGSRQRLEAALVRDLSWAALRRLYRCDPKTARAWVIAAIKALRTI